MREFTGTPFCWQSKKVTRLIKAHFKDQRAKCSAITVYQALTEMASDKNSDNFREYFVVIADIAGINAKTFGSIMRSFSQLGILKFSRGRYSGNRYEMAIIELLDLPEATVDTCTKSAPVKSKKTEEEGEKPRVLKNQHGYIEEPVKSLGVISDRLKNDKLKKTLSVDEINNILIGVEKHLKKSDIINLKDVLNKNQLGNLIFESWVSISGHRFIEPVKVDRSRVYRQKVRPVQDIVRYMVSKDTNITIKSIIDQMVAWANNGLSWEISTVLKHIEKTPDQIKEMSRAVKGKDIVPPKHLTGKKYKSHIQL